MKEQLKELITALGISQKAFGERIDIKSAFISDILNGRAKGFSSESLAAIHKAYNVNINWLLTGDGEMFLTSASTGSAQRSPDEEPPKVMQSDAGNGKKNGHLTGIDGNVETYPEITSIEQIARTGWWANLTEEDRELYAINEELPHDATMRLRDAAEYEYRVNEKRIEEKKSQLKSLRQKGEAG